MPDEIKTCESCGRDFCVDQAECNTARNMFCGGCCSPYLLEEDHVEEQEDHNEQEAEA